MIGKLKGIVDSIEEKHVIIDVNGVGYFVYASRMSLGSMAEGETISMLIETHVREDHIHLYGFATKAEKEWFNILTTVKGVGTKMGLAILSVMSPISISTAIASKDKASFIQVSGVGTKLAERILTELKDKSGMVVVGDDSIMGGVAEISTIMKSAQNDAISALTNLGYSKSDVFLSITNFAKENKHASVEELIKFGLKELNS